MNNQVKFEFDKPDAPEMLAYHKENPHIYDAFKDVTLRAIGKGMKHFSATAVFNIVRWERSETAAQYDGFKVNNNYAAFYPRLFEKDFPQHQGFFFKRQSKYDTITN